MGILIADLSGYTALTEAHGAMAAADIVDRYIEIVRDCLVGDSHLHERVGDEVMIVSPSAENLQATALLLLQATRSEENFLLVHGGLHWGSLLRRNNSYFGTAINLASRIAAKATAGTIWCSKDFIAALSSYQTSSFKSRGKYDLKNISEEIELFELQADQLKKIYVDPVCRMLVLNEEKAHSHPSAPGTYFCSSDCMNSFITKKITLSL